MAVSAARLMAGERVAPDEHFPFLHEADREMTAEETERYFEDLAARMGGGAGTIGTGEDG